MIVVIWILAVLVVLWTLYLMRWLAKARDAVRISDITTITKSLDIYWVKEAQYPEPDNNIDIYVDGDLLVHQGEFGSGVIKKVAEINKVPKDPADKVYYTYVVSEDYTGYKVLWFLETEEIIVYSNTVEALSFKDREPVFKGDDICVVLNEENVPLEKLWLWEMIDLSATNNTYRAIYKDGIWEWKWWYICTKKCDGICWGKWIGDDHWNPWWMDVIENNNVDWLVYTNLYSNKLFGVNLTNGDINFTKEIFYGSYEFWIRKIYKKDNKYYIFWGSKRIIMTDQNFNVLKAIYLSGVSLPGYPEVYVNRPYAYILGRKRIIKIDLSTFDIKFAKEITISDEYHSDHSIVYFYPVSYTEGFILWKFKCDSSDPGCFFYCKINLQTGDPWNCYAGIRKYNSETSLFSVSIDSNNDKVYLWWKNRYINSGNMIVQLDKDTFKIDRAKRVWVPHWPHIVSFDDGVYFVGVSYNDINPLIKFDKQWEVVNTGFKIYLRGPLQEAFVDRYGNLLLNRWYYEAVVKLYYDKLYKFEGQNLNVYRWWYRSTTVVQYFDWQIEDMSESEISPWASIDFTVNDLNVELVDVTDDIRIEDIEIDYGDLFQF